MTRTFRGLLVQGILTGCIVIVAKIEGKFICKRNILPADALCFRYYGSREESIRIYISNPEISFKSRKITQIHMLKYISNPQIYSNRIYLFVYRKNSSMQKER